MQRKASLRSTRWVLATFVTVLMLVVGGGVAVALTRHRSGAPTMAAPTPTAEESATAPSPASPSGDDGFDPGAGTGSKTDPGPSRSGGSGPRCQYLPTSGTPSGQRLSATPNPRATMSAHPHVRLTTSQGVIEVDLAADAAPCTVNSLLTLARGGFFTGTGCHRLTTEILYVLQCGDPTGTGQGGPGYRFGDENLPTASRPAYPRGTLAMANAGPGTNGSQFFLVYKDSEIDPNYSVFGRITAGLDVLDKIAAAGADNANGPGDGHPNVEVTISRVG
ncbi:MAG TPA: peptidylprolyl isomerase [Planosporangium sp.]|jgi:peptidyl-prolyl cis-trans isomerase B (cyclophilin B)|nr:peptidylprolyl isomerase [Planosporangium sp.]